jgi:hypothetical protein
MKILRPDEHEYLKEVGADLNATRIDNPGSPLRRRGQGISRQSYEQHPELLIRHPGAPS